MYCIRNILAIDLFINEFFAKNILIHNTKTKTFLKFLLL